MKHLHIILGIFMLSLSRTSMENSTKLVMATAPETITAGENAIITLSNHNAPLVIYYALGSTLIEGSTANEVTSYTIPEFITHKRGVITWQSNIDNGLQGNIQVLPQQRVERLETYVGPPSILAGTVDFSMMVGIPLDVYDNPLPEGTPVNFNHLYLNRQFEKVVEVNHLIAFDEIYSRPKRDRLTLSAHCQEIRSKEYTVYIEATVPLDFSLSRKRTHNYADGNQTMTISTSVIKDTYGNVVSDGTYVIFYIKNSEGGLLQMAGTTINGVAQAQMVHPDYPTTWEVSAAISNMAKSKPLKVSFIPALQDYEVIISTTERTISVAPMISFMNQLMPDGTKVHLEIKNDELHLEKTQESYLGTTTFTIEEREVPDGTYQVTMTVCGIKKVFKEVTW